MDRIFEIFVPLLFAVFGTWGGIMLTPSQVRRLEQARIAFIFAALCLFVEAVWISAKMDGGIVGVIVVSIITGAIVGGISWAMWLAIDSEIAESENGVHEE